jgi:hypothetical protein
VHAPGVDHPAGVVIVRGEHGRLLAQWQVRDGVANGRLAPLAAGLRHLRVYYSGPLQTPIKQVLVVRVP